MTVSIAVNQNVDLNESGDQTECSIDLSFPSQEPGGSLGSQVWPAAIASTILLQSPEFQLYSQGKDLVELGCGVGWSGLVAAKSCASCLLTDNDEEAIAILKKTFQMNQYNVLGVLESQTLDWRDSHDTVIPVDIVLGVDVAYYYHLLRPIMDTSRAFMKESGSLLVFIGQANRESLWDLYKNFRDGCYNQLTDKHEPPWPGETRMYLYNLQMSCWVRDDGERDFEIDGVVPISVILHHPNGLSDFSFFRKHAHPATEKDDETILKSF